MTYRNPEDCRAYHKKHYKMNRIQEVRKNKRNRDSTREYINQYRIDKPCTDCNQKLSYWQLEFDHVRGEKVYNVCSMPGQFGIDKIKDEIAKCDIVCVNCHAMRTWMRRMLTKSSRNFHYTNVRKLIDIKESLPCNDCNKHFRYFQMQFDHLPQFVKSFNLGIANVVGKEWNEIQQEINKCELVCGNCHTTRTHTRKRGVA